MKKQAKKTPPLLVKEDELNDWILTTSEFLSNQISQYAENKLLSSLPKATSETVLSRYTTTPADPQVTALEVGKRSLSLDLTQMISAQKVFHTNSTMISSSRTKSNLDKSIDVGEDIDITASFVGKRHGNWQQHRKKAQGRRNTAGKEWFDLPMGKVNKDRILDHQVLQMRGSLLSAGHYMNVEKSKLPKYFHVGTVIEGNTDGRMRITKRNRQRSVADQFMNDEDIKARVKKRARSIGAGVVRNPSSKWKNQKGSKSKSR